MRAATGLPADFCCGRDGAFCSWTLLPKNPEILVIEDTIKDARSALYQAFGNLQQHWHCEIYKIFSAESRPNADSRSSTT